MATLMEDAFGVLLEAGVRPKEIIGLVLQIHHAVDGVLKDGDDGDLARIFHEQRRARGIPYT
jgi:hypothetical protein